MNREIKKQSKVRTGALMEAASFLLLALWLGTDILFQVRQLAFPFRPLLRCAVPCLLFLCSYLGVLLQFNGVKKRQRLRVLFGIYFAIYLYLLISFTLFDFQLRISENQLPADGMSERQYYLNYFVNFVPFDSIYRVYYCGLKDGVVSLSYVWLNFHGNLAVLMPLALFLPLFLPFARKPLCFSALIFAIAILIESLQFFWMVGSCDVDDVILNTGGALLLFGILHIPLFRRFSLAFLQGF